MEFTGIVEKGKGYGAPLGFPTANIPLTEDISGIYAGLVTVGGVEYRAAIYADTRRKLLESHLLDFTGDLYEKQLSVHLLTKLREDQEFADEKALTAQIREDIRSTQAFFSSEEYR